MAMETLSGNGTMVNKDCGSGRAACAAKGPRSRVTGGVLAAGTLFILLVAVGTYFALVDDNVAEAAMAMTEKIGSMGAWGCAAAIGLMSVHSFVPFPAEFLALAAGGIYGTMVGTALIWIGAMVGAALSFGLSRRLGRPFAEAMLTAKQRNALDTFSLENGTVTLLASRFVPVISFNLVNYAAGLTPIGWWTFLWTTGLGILPLTFLMVWMGSRMGDLSWTTLGVVSLLGVLSLIGFRWFVKRRQRQEVPATVASAGRPSASS